MNEQAKTYGQLDAMYQAVRALSMIETSQGTAEKPDDITMIERIFETKAHQEILVSLRGLRASLEYPDLADFEADFLRCLSSVYHDPEQALSEGAGWCFFSPNGAAQVRPVVIRNVTGLYAALSDRLNPGVRGHRVLTAGPASGACPAVGDVCADIFNWLQRQPSVGEESITDWLLYTLSERLRWVRYLKFTRHEEAKYTGADWEWWILGDRQCLGMRVQAKKTRGHPDLYPLMAYSNRRGLQIERLLEGARSANLLPLFAVYDAPSPVPPVACGAAPHTRPCGVFVVGAKQMYDDHIAPGRRPLDLLHLLRSCHPLSCLFCCSQSVDTSSASYFNNVAAQIARVCSGRHGEESQESDSENTGMHEEPPPYIRALIDAAEAADARWIETEFASALQEVNAIVAFDLRGSPQEGSQMIHGA